MRLKILLSSYDKNTHLDIKNQRSLFVKCKKMQRNVIKFCSSCGFLKIYLLLFHSSTANTVKSLKR